MRNLIIILLCFFHLVATAQTWVPSAIADMPFATTNNSVCEAKVNGVDYMFSFGGLDTSKKFTGIHQESFRYNVSTNTWNGIGSLPDTLGKIAGAASYIKNKIYIMGGYHVYNDGSELSSSRVHIYNPSTNVYETDGSPIPVPTDDHAQVVWNDSLVYLIGGWSNTTNIDDVQVYDPAMDTWQAATPLPNNNQYKFFGAQATMLGDTIFYYGGAVINTNFPAIPAMRIGIIDPTNPLTINWLSVKFYSPNALYRSIGITNPNEQITFLGGSKESYNYNGLAYDGGVGVAPANMQVIYNPADASFKMDTSQSFPMDLRGLANVSPNVKYICGGMEQNQKVSKKAYKLTYMSTVATSDFAKDIGLKVYPNPTTDQIIVSANKFIKQSKFAIINSLGQIVKNGLIENKQFKISLSDVPAGNYYLVLDIAGNNIAKAIMKMD